MNRRGLSLLLAIASCHGTAMPSPPTTPATQHGAAPSVERRSLPFDGDPNGVLWQGDRLLVADDDHNRVRAWTEAQGFTTLVELPPVGEAHVGLGGIAQLRDGTLLVARLGDVGDVVLVPPGGTPRIIEGLDPRRRRIGLTVGPDDRVFATWFVRDGEVRSGGIEEIDRSGGARDLVTGLRKPVGVVVRGRALVVSDQFAGRLVRIDLDGPPRLVELAGGLEHPDLLALLPDGAVVTGDARGRLLAIDPAGAVHELATDLPGVRGVAVDATGQRLFVAVHGDDGGPPRIEILPLPPSRTRHGSRGGRTDRRHGGVDRSRARRWFGLDPHTLEAAR